MYHALCYVPCLKKQNSVAPFKKFKIYIERNNKIWCVCRVDMEIHHLDSPSRKDLLLSCQLLRGHLQLWRAILPKVWGTHIQWSSQRFIKFQPLWPNSGHFDGHFSPDVLTRLAEVLSDPRHSLMSLPSPASSIFYPKMLTLNIHLISQISCTHICISVCFQRIKPAQCHFSLTYRRHVSPEQGI